MALAGLLLTVSLATPTSVFCAVAPDVTPYVLIRYAKEADLVREIDNDRARNAEFSNKNLIVYYINEINKNTKKSFNSENLQESLQLCANAIAKIQLILKTNQELKLDDEQQMVLRKTIEQMSDIERTHGANFRGIRPVLQKIQDNLSVLANNTATAAPSLPVVAPEALASRRPATASTTVSEGPAGAGSGAGAAFVSTPAISEGTAGAGSGAGSYDTSREAYNAIKRQLARYRAEGENAPAALFKDIALSIAGVTADNKMVGYGDGASIILNAMMEETAPECLILMDAYGVVPTSADLELLEDVQITLALNLGAESSAAKSLLQVINKAREVMARPKAAVTTPASAGAGAGASAAATPLPAPLSAEERELLSARTHVLGLLETYKLDNPDYRSTVAGESQEACRDRRANYIFDSFCVDIELITNTVTLEGNQTTASILSSLRRAILSFRVMIEMDFLPSVDVVEKLKQIGRKFALTEHPLFSHEQKKDALRLVREIKILLIKKGHGAKYWPECDVCSGRMTKQEASVNPDARICMDDGTARGAGAGAGSSGK